MYAASRSRGLGLAPVIVAAAIPVIPGLLHSIFGNDGTPPTDQIQLARIAQAFSLAVINDPTPQATLPSNLHALGGEAYLHWIADNVAIPGGTSSASPVARRAAQAALVELGARRAATGVVGTVLPLSTIPATIGGTVQQTLTNPVVLLGGAAAVYFLLRRRRAR
jgi:hypothetical protein